MLDTDATPREIKEEHCSAEEDFAINEFNITIARFFRKSFQNKFKNPAQANFIIKTIFTI